MITSPTCASFDPFAGDCRIVIDVPKEDFTNANLSRVRSGGPPTGFCVELYTMRGAGLALLLCRSARRMDVDLTIRYSDERLREIVASWPDTPVPLYR